MKKLTLLTLFCALATGAMAGDGWNDYKTIFKVGELENTEKPGTVTSFRIPAITTTSQGTIVAVSDIRYGGQHGNTDIADGSNKVNPVHFAIKVSHDGGNTWSESQIVGPQTGNGYITDPSIVHNPETGKTFLFGYQNDKHLTNGGGNNKFFVYSSDDGGKTWDTGKEIQDSISLGDGYKYTLQGPGSGMYYNGNIYMAIQGWKPKKENGQPWKSVSGFMYSDDNGKTWKTATLDGVLPEGINTSESNIFHHNGKIYLAAKNENAQAGGGVSKDTRIVYATSDNGKTWEKVEENFLPDNMAKCETSSFSLSDQVYLVGFAMQGQNGWDRNDIYVTTNTGRKIKLFEGSTKGYTSMVQDQDNLYILFEDNDKKDDKNEGQILFRRFDIASKEYANLNAQILDRGQSLLDVQGKLSSDQYVGGTYTNKSESGAEAVVELNNFKIGAFHRNTKDNSDDVYRTIPYNLKETTLVLSQDNAFMQGDNIFAGYQAGKIEYSNKSTNDLTSFVMGYTFNKELENDKTYTFALNGVYSNNKVERNKAEGVGRTAEFDSYSISMKNALSKNISFTDSSNLKLTAGLNTTVFGHDEFEEDGGIQTVDGGKWNNAKVDKSQNVSNEIFAKATLDQRVKLTDKSSVRLALDLGWEKELMDVDEWRDEFTVLDVEKEFATPVKKHEGGLGKAEVSATFDLAEKVELGVGYSMDTDGESTATGKVTYKL